MAGFLFFAIFLGVPVYLVFCHNKAHEIERNRIETDKNLRLHQANVQALNVDTQRVKAGLPGLPGVVDAYLEVSSQLHKSPLTVQSVITAPPQVSSVEESNAVQPSVEQVIPAPQIAEMYADKTIGVRLDATTEVLLSYFSDFDIYQAHICVNGSIVGSRIETYHSASSLNEEVMLADACKKARLHFAATSDHSSAKKVAAA